MKKIISALPLLGIVLLLGSCTVYRTSIPQAGIQAQVNLGLGDLEYVRDVQGTATQSYVIGLPIGGTKYKRGVVSNFNIGLPGLPALNQRGFNSAMFDALESVPDADFILPLSMEVVTHQMFLGRQDSIIVKAKVFKIKGQ
jgi:hypothetical protein